MFKSDLMKNVNIMTEIRMTVDLSVGQYTIPTSGINVCDRDLWRVIHIDTFPLGLL